MKTITISVTQQDLNSNLKSKGRIGIRCSECPVATAISRALNAPILVNGTAWRYADKDYNQPSCRLPEFVWRKTRELDAAFSKGIEHTVEPFTFEVQIP